MDLNRVNPCSAGLDKTKPCVISSLASLGWWEGNHSQRDRCPYLSLVLPSAPLPVFSMDENQPEAWGQGSPHNQPLKSRERRKMIPHNGGVKWRANNSEFQWYRYQVYFSSVAQTCPILCDPWTTARQAPLSITSSQRLLKLMSIESVMTSNHLILVTFFSSCPQSFPESGSFAVSQFFTSGGQSIRASALASVLPMNIQDWFPLGLTGLILKSKGLSRVFSNTTVQKHQFFGAQLSL